MAFTATGTNHASGTLPVMYTAAVRAAQQGDEQGFRFLYEKTYRDKLYIARKYMKNEADAQDVLQDAYLRAWQNLYTLQEPEKFPSWLSMIVANTALNALKKKQPMLFSELSVTSEDGDTLAYEEPDFKREYQPEHAYTDAETSALLQEMIDSLSDEQRFCVLMYYIEEHSVGEIAAAAGCSENTVKSRLHYGRKNLKAKTEELEKRGYTLYGLSAVPLLYTLMHTQAHAMAATAPPAAGAMTAAARFSGMQHTQPAEQAAQLSGMQHTQPAEQAARFSGMQYTPAAEASAQAESYGGLAAVKEAAGTAAGAAAGTGLAAGAKAAIAVVCIIALGAGGVGAGALIANSRRAASQTQTDGAAQNTAAGAEGVVPPERLEAWGGAALREVNEMYEALDPAVQARFEELFAEAERVGYGKWLYLDDDEYPELYVADETRLAENGAPEFTLYWGKTAEVVEADMGETVGYHAYTFIGHTAESGGSFFVPRRGILVEDAAVTTDMMINEQLTITKTSFDNPNTWCSVLTLNEEGVLVLDYALASVIDLRSKSYTYYEIRTAGAGFVHREITAEEFSALHYTDLLQELDESGWSRDLP